MAIPDIDRILGMNQVVSIKGRLRFSAMQGNWSTYEEAISRWQIFSNLATCAPDPSRQLIEYVGLRNFLRDAKCSLMKNKQPSDLNLGLAWAQQNFQSIYISYRGSATMHHWYKKYAALIDA